MDRFPNVVYGGSRYDGYILGWRLLFAGDLIFAGSVGRTDLPGGNFEMLRQSILEQVYTLPDDTRILPGHGPETTVGEEKRTNPSVHL
jgi:glyoxylase-like metal-dependent hydrolase (beta-lactamase superfamily II)